MYRFDFSFRFPANKEIPRTSNTSDAEDDIIVSDEEEDDESYDEDEKDDDEEDDEEEEEEEEENFLADVRSLSDLPLSRLLKVRGELQRIEEEEVAETRSLGSE